MALLQYLPVEGALLTSSTRGRSKPVVRDAERQLMVTNSRAGRSGQTLDLAQLSFCLALTRLGAPLLPDAPNSTPLALILGGWLYSVVN